MQGQCSNCKGLFDVQPEWIGQQAECPYCHQQIIIQLAYTTQATPSSASRHESVFEQHQNLSNSSKENIASLRAFECYLKVLRNYITFSGRASRKEYWYFFLFNSIVAFCIGFIGGFLGMGDTLGNLYSLAVFLPGLAVCIRRLHDINKSGWWFLIVLIPIAGAILLIIDLCHKGTTGPNQYGSDPYEACC